MAPANYSNYGAMQLISLATRPTLVACAIKTLWQLKNEASGL